MMVSEEDKQAVGYTDMRVYQGWLAAAHPIVRALAVLYPPSVYRMTSNDGEVVRVFPQEYSMGPDGSLSIAVVAVPELNPEWPGMARYRVTEVPLSKLTPIKWPPDARVH